MKDEGDRRGRVVVIAVIAVAWSVLSLGCVLMGPSEPTFAWEQAVLACLIPVGVFALGLAKALTNCSDLMILVFASAANGLWWSLLIYSLWSIASGVWARRAT